MLSAQLEGVEAGIIAFPKGNHILGRVAFTGKATGRVCLRIPPEIARLAAANILGATVEEMGNDTEVDDVIDELTNMVVGNFKSNLCDAGPDCKLRGRRRSRSTRRHAGTPALRGGLRTGVSA